MAAKPVSFSEKEKEKDVRSSNILAAQAVAYMIRTSLGPRGMDKMIANARGDVTISNDGATILSELKLSHPAARMMVEVSKAQDVEAGDGTTSVVVMTGSMLGACKRLFELKIHPTVIADSFKKGAIFANEVLKGIATPLDLNDKQALVNLASTSLSSKIVSQHSGQLAPIAVDAVLQILESEASTNVDLSQIKVVKMLGGTMEDTELVNGLLFPQGADSKGGISRVENAKIGLIQFCLSNPKSNMDNQVVLDNYHKMDRFLEQEKRYIGNLCRAIKKTGCNVLLIQKSILRDAITDISRKFLGDMKIMVIKDIERADIEWISKALGCKPAASIETFTADKLGTAALVEEEHTTGGKLVRITGCPDSKTVSILCRGSNKLLLDECERSVHDALCVVRSMVKSRYVLPGGGAPEIELSLQLAKYANTLQGRQAHCVKEYAKAFEIIPYTLAENAGLSPISIVTELRNKHANGEKNAGINVRKGAITNILEENVLQPLLVTQSCLQLATETVAMMLKIDDIVDGR